jgi:hypothetical protein
MHTPCKVGNSQTPSKRSNFAPNFIRTETVMLLQFVILLFIVCYAMCKFIHDTMAQIEYAQNREEERERMLCN